MQEKAVSVPCDLSSEAIFTRQIKAIPKLDKETEFAVALEWRGTKNRELAHILVLANLYIVSIISKEFKNFQVCRMDLMQEGVIGLMNAVNRFDPDKNVRVSTFAPVWIRGAMHDFILKSWSLVKVGTTQLQIKIFSGLKHNKESIAEMEHENADEVAAKYNTTAEKYKKIANMFTSRDASIDMRLDDGRSIGETLVSNTPSPECLVMEEDYDIKKAKVLYEAISKLNEKQKVVLTERFLAENPATLKQISISLNVSIERVRQIEKEAMLKISKSKELREIMDK